MAKITFIVLCHESVENVSHLAKLLVDGHPDWHVVLHYDRNSNKASFAKLKEATSTKPQIHCLENRVKCGWGDFSLVEATLRGLHYIRDHKIECDRVILISGACLPNRSLEDLNAFIDKYVDHEFIEINKSDWIVGGLRAERYLYHHVVNHRKYRWLFNRMYLTQRKLGFKRTFPKQMVPLFGSQWWALTWSTCEEILDFLQQNPKVKRFFKSTWIPDEMFFQTLVSHLRPADRIHSRSLTFYKFNDWGMPLVFLNDHQDIVKSLPYFFVRKVSGRALKLRAELDRVAKLPNDGSNPMIDPDEKYRFPDREMALEALATPDNHTRLFSRLEPQNLFDGMMGQTKPILVVFGPPELTNRAAKALKRLHSLDVLGRIFDKDIVDFGSGRYHFGGYTRWTNQLRDTFPATYFKILLDRCEGIPVVEVSPLDNPEIISVLAGSSRTVFYTIVPRQRGKAWSDFYWLSCLPPSESVRLDHAKFPYEYVRQTILVSEIDPDLMASVEKIMETEVNFGNQTLSDKNAKYKSGAESIELLLPALPHAQSGVADAIYSDTLSQHPPEVAEFMRTQGDGSKLWDVRIGLDYEKILVPALIEPVLR